MKTTTWTRNGGHVAVVLFENARSCAVFDGPNCIMKTEVGATKLIERIRAICGDDYGLRNLRDLEFSTNPADGTKIRNYHYENLTKI
jgi:hypothetical protein